MEVDDKKCSLKKHSEIKAVIYCVDCKRYLCNKCKNNHSELFEDHQFLNLDKNIKDIFTGYCTENNHNISLEYFCKVHNKLCCAACITKIEGEGKGQHSNCDVCLLKEIKDEKMNKLKDNIILLENLYNKFEESLRNIKVLSIEINKNKEELKTEIQKIFTKLRNSLNKREELLLLEVDEEYNKYFINEDIINKNEKLPEKIKSALENGKKVNKGRYNDPKLNALINDCINVENNVNNEINKVINIIESFGGLSNNDIKSKILSKIDFIKIQDWLKPNFDEIKNYELIYRATEHGDTNAVSFQKCKNIPNLLWIMKDKNNNIFGCFHSIAMNINGDYSKDYKCFLFSLNKNKKYIPNLNIQNNIYNCSSHVIEFGNNNVFEFVIGNKFLSDSSVTFVNGPIFNHNYEISNNNQLLSLSELEVYRII